MNKRNKTNEQGFGGFPSREAEQLPEDVMYRALLEKDPAYEGVFVTAVKTTGVFCRSTCTARKPLRENVEFFRTPGEALAYGYRPCKICRPMEYKGAAPDWLKSLLAEIEKNPESRFRDCRLREIGVEPNRLRRWFKVNHGMTFQGYLRSLRIGGALGRIRFGESLAAAAFDSGYESLSGFSDSLKKSAGISPSEGKTAAVITLTRVLTPLGPMAAGALDQGICLLEFTDRRMLETQFKRLKRLLNASFITGRHRLFEPLQHQLDEYFAGVRREFDIPLFYPGTAFQVRVWEQLRKIPYGETRSYGLQAEYLGNPSAIRAVARANGDNRISIIIPCHRVIGANGEMVGYGGGVPRKQYLLNLEQGLLPGKKTPQ